MDRMRKRLPRVALAVVWAVLGSLGIGCAADTGVRSSRAGIPQLRRDAAGVTRLMVDGEPFLILGGEIGNSSASSADSLKEVWPAVRRMNLNTVLAPVYWELIEPAEGRFDFSLVDRLIADARANRMRLVLLWFGAWKNSMSTYTPAWVKADPQRFPYARDAKGRPIEILSALAGTTRDADARAYGALMRHLREVDGNRHTVLMVQVENEIGFVPDAREHGALADAAWAGPVPQELTEHLKRNRDKLEPELRSLWEKHGGRTSGPWTEMFGDDPAGQEVFMA
jgi:beta-galactosidase GanA